jgi:ribosomal protein S18 acetylase RimI-like enzyme
MFTNPFIRLADDADIPAISNLLNSAYRGESSRQGWTTEADLIAGEQRADEAMVKEVLDMPGSVIMVYQEEQNEVTGCVNLQQHDDRMYLGMFSVSPKLQGGGIGKVLLQASEDYSKQVGSRSIYMSVISLRTELINWYIRHGYKDTGERRPFVEDGKTGKHLRELKFMMLEKALI